MSKKDILINAAAMAPKTTDAFFVIAMDQAGVCQINCHGNVYQLSFMLANSQNFLMKVLDGNTPQQQMLNNALPAD